MKILGISAYYHDSSVALLVDDTIIAAAQEERFTRIKHDNSFPAKACRFCLDYAGYTLEDIDAVVFYEKPFLKFERILESQIATFPRSFKMFLKTSPIWLKEKLNMRKLIGNEFKKIFGVKPKSIKFVEHHISHAAFAYCASGFNESDILVVDAVGEWATTSNIRATGNSFEVLSEQRFPDSIGLLYSAFTQFLGFKVNSDEYKVMGLAPYGLADNAETIEFIRLIRTKILSGIENGFPILNLGYFSYQYGDRMICVEKWEHLFRIKARKSQGEILQSHMNLAYAIQNVTEELLTNLTKSMSERSSSRKLCICGGVALNCAANGYLIGQGNYENIYVPFAPGDCGCSIGAALAYDLLSRDKKPTYHISPYLGPSYNRHEIFCILESNGLNYVEVQNDNELCMICAKLISDGNIIGWFQGRMEMGPRALGNRSILADARDALMKDKVNSRIKFREGFRPFAPSVKEDKAPALFIGCSQSPYMMFTYHVLGDTIPAVTHIDGTARVQTVSKTDNPLYYELLSAFESITCCSAFLNTSFNVIGEPIVCTPQDAINTFNKSGLDYLIIGNFIVKK